MSTLLTALALLGFVALIIGILVFVHNKDKKADETAGTTSSSSSSLTGT